MELRDKSAVLDMMTVFYASPAVLHKAPCEVLERDIDDCVGECPFVEGTVIEVDGEIAGYAMTSMGYSTEYGGISVMLEDLYLRPEYRGRGIGSAFLLHLQESLKGRAVRLRLEAEPSNLRAIEVYKKCGFAVLPYTEMTVEL
ncbi:MAG: GNAT family N-acetyltransferase [Clostridia bacterium]|nr:GNAT family N-acetyltransferase [Clostridia bacterium]